MERIGILTMGSTSGSIPQIIHIMMKAVISGKILVTLILIKKQGHIIVCLDRATVKDIKT